MDLNIIIGKAWGVYLKNNWNPSASLTLSLTTKPFPCSTMTGSILLSFCAPCCWRPLHRGPGWSFWDINQTNLTPVQAWGQGEKGEELTLGTGYVQDQTLSLFKIVIFYSSCIFELISIF